MSFDAVWARRTPADTSTSKAALIRLSVPQRWYNRIFELASTENVNQEAEQLAAVIDEIRRRVRARHPDGVLVGDIPLTDLTPLLRARDAAEAKVAAIGSVNPRPGGLKNSIIQFVKRQIARALDWHVREQIEFNRAVLICVQSAIEALNENNRTFRELASENNRALRELTNELTNDLTNETNRKFTALANENDRTFRELAVQLEGLGQTTSGLRDEMQYVRAEAQEMRDLRTHWHAWREAWERKLSENEIHYLRGLAELQAAFQHRVTLMDQHYREKMDAQNADFHAELARYSEDVQKRLWVELAKVRTEYEALIHNELRVVRQKLSFARAVSEAAGTAAALPASAGLAAIDWLRFADRFRGSEESVKQRQQLYAERFAGQSGVLDLGCGRGEMLEVLREAGISARGVDLHEESLALCAAKGLDVEKADLFQYLDSLPDSSLGGVICAQVVEHLLPERLPDLVRLIHAKLRRNALVAIETPNPECLAIFATHFFLDPTHQRPVPAPLLTFYLEEAGFGAIEIVRLSPAVESMPSLARLPKDVRNDFFGALDYAAFARKL
jgi:2-polyprenyl-3-methyl-5-hydroxy-6-metoxy-1,4-benzoquinol methylase